MTFHRHGISATPLPNACRKNIDGKYVCLAAARKIGSVRRPGPWPCEFFVDNSPVPRRCTQKQKCAFVHKGEVITCTCSAARHKAKEEQQCES